MATDTDNTRNADPTADMAAALVALTTAFAAWTTEAVPAAFKWLADSSKEAVQTIRCVWAVAVAALRVSVLQRFMNDNKFTVYKVCAFNEDTGEDLNVTRGFDASEWEESVRVASGWYTQPVRADVRYMAHGKKYRMVLRPGDTCELTEVPERHRGGPKGVMAAELVGEEATVNITRRVLKYQGPQKDFHRGMGLRVGVTDMFPFDDADELKLNFQTMRVVDAHARVHDIPVTCDDLAAALAATSKTD